MYYNNKICLGQTSWLCM